MPGFLREYCIKGTVLIIEAKAILIKQSTNFLQPGNPEQILNPTPIRITTGNNRNGA
jgi:hypothetical protein